MESLNTCTVGIVAPTWLIEPLAVLILAAPNTELWAYATSAGELLSIPVDESPDVLVLHISDGQEVDQIRQVKAAWPRTRFIALLKHPRERGAAEEAGADAVLLEGLAPGWLLETLDSLRVGSDHDPSGDQMP